MVSYENFIKTLAESNNRLAVSNAKDITKWDKLKHTKEDLELFLNHNLAEVFFKTKNGETKRVVACSNTTLVKMFSMKTSSTDYKKKIHGIRTLKSNGIHSKSKTSVLSWDFLKNDYCKIQLGEWYLGNWITISEENIVILNDTLKDILEFKKVPTR